MNTLEAATNRLHQLCVAATGHVIEKRRYAELGIPERARQLIERSWEEDTPSIYGRFDLRFDGTSPPKLLEYNTDTPTALYEAGVVQWKWLEEVFPGSDQLNPSDPNLLEAYFEPGRLSRYAKKPLFSRECSNVTLFDEKGAFAEVGGDYGEEGFIYQALAPLPEFDGQKAVLGSWMVGQESAGVGIRESAGPITTNRSRFVPHRME